MFRAFGLPEPPQSTFYSYCRVSGKSDFPVRSLTQLAFTERLSFAPRAAKVGSEPKAVIFLSARGRSHLSLTLRRVHALTIYDNDNR